MPIYTVSTPRPLDGEAKRAVAAAVTHAHCEVTGAPDRWVSVIFGAGYRLPAGIHASVLGGIRGGGNRTAEVVATLAIALARDVATCLNDTPATVAVDLREVPANQVFEGGFILPDPGAEASWPGNQPGRHAGNRNEGAIT